MAEPRLSPTELDRLEDALEDLEFGEEIHDPSAVVAGRLADYRLILAASREAFPLEDVPAGTLHGVLREAGMTVEDTVERVAAKAEDKPGFWARFRKSFLLPSLAVAGSAALVLVMVRPSMDDAAAPSVESSGAVAKRDMSAAEEDAPASAAAKGEASAPAPAAAKAPLPLEQQDKDASQLGGTRSGAAPRSAVAAEVQPEPEPEPEPEAEESADAKADAPVEPAKEKPGAVSPSGWEAVERGDTARTGGDCFTARNHYARALDDGNDSVRARAFAGLGLCKEKDGEDAAAAEFFERARELDPEADDYAGTQQSERKAKPSPARPARKRSSKKRKTMDAADPFE